MKEIAIAVFVGEASQSPSTTTDGEVQGELHDCENVGRTFADHGGSESRGK